MHNCLQIGCAKQYGSFFYNEEGNSVNVVPNCNILSRTSNEVGNGKNLHWISALSIKTNILKTFQSYTIEVVIILCTFCLPALLVSALIVGKYGQQFSALACFSSLTEKQRETPSWPEKCAQFTKQSAYLFEVWI